jgi:hypothetical protein
MIILPWQLVSHPWRGLIAIGAFASWARIVVISRSRDHPPPAEENEDGRHGLDLIEAHRPSGRGIEPDIVFRATRSTIHGIF